jgi:hypothetical protein
MWENPLGYWLFFIPATAPIPGLIWDAGLNLPWPSMRRRAADGRFGATNVHRPSRVQARPNTPRRRREARADIFSDLA